MPTTLSSRLSCLVSTGAITLALGAGCGHPTDASAVYRTYGTHNAPGVSPCASPDCVYTRGPGEPTDPEYPPYWISPWTMYRVFAKYKEYPPPYDGKPPPQLVENVDYEVSYGETDYDSTYRGPHGEGAMMERYKKRCLPIFPIPNDFSCAFISLGEVAYFVTYPEDRPKDMPPVCLFSPLNHPPRRNFIGHLPYSAADSARLQNRVQGYSFWVDASSGRPVQTGVSPDLTAAGDIMFGYGFWATPSQDAADAAPYRHPQSFYFSGYPLDPPNAPIVSQNYTGFTAKQPDPAQTWSQVDQLTPDSLPKCQLFEPPQQHGLTAGRRAPTWGDIGKKR